MFNRFAPLKSFTGFKKMESFDVSRILETSKCPRTHRVSWVWPLNYIM